MGAHPCSLPKGGGFIFPIFFPIHLGLPSLREGLGVGQLVLSLWHQCEMVAHGHLVLICLRVGNVNEVDAVVKGTNGEAFGVGKGKGRGPVP